MSQLITKSTNEVGEIAWEKEGRGWVLKTLLTSQSRKRACRSFKDHFPLAPRETLLHDFSKKDIQVKEGGPSCFCFKQDYFEKLISYLLHIDLQDPKKTSVIKVPAHSESG